MNVRLHKPRQDKFPSDIEPLASCRRQSRGNLADTPVLNGDVLLLPGNNAALHNQIVHASSCRSLSSRRGTTAFQLMGDCPEVL